MLREKNRIEIYSRIKSKYNVEDKVDFLKTRAAILMLYLNCQKGEKEKNSRTPLAFIFPEGGALPIIEFRCALYWYLDSGEKSQTCDL